MSLKNSHTPYQIKNFSTRTNFKGSDAKWMQLSCIIKNFEQKLGTAYPRNNLHSRLNILDIEPEGSYCTPGLTQCTESSSTSKKGNDIIDRKASQYRHNFQLCNTWKSPIIPRLPLKPCLETYSRRSIRLYWSLMWFILHITKPFRQTKLGQQQTLKSQTCLPLRFIFFGHIILHVHSLWQFHGGKPLIHSQLKLIITFLDIIILESSICDKSSKCTLKIAFTSLSV